MSGIMDAIQHVANRVEEGIRGAENTIIGLSLISSLFIYTADGSLRHT